MKKILPALIAVVVLLLTGCKPSPEKLAEKIASGEPLTEEEYTEVIEHTLNVLEVINDSIEVHRGDFRAMVNSLKMISATHPEAEIIVTHLEATDPTTLDDKNRELYEQLMAGIEKMGATIAESGPVFRTKDLSKIEPDGSSKEKALSADSVSEEKLQGPEPESLNAVSETGMKKVQPKGERLN